MKNIFRRALILLAIIAQTTIVVYAQDTVIVKHGISYIDSLQSAILQQTRIVQVILPENYQPQNAARYDVLYVLDGGNWNTGPIKNIQRFVEGENYMPPTIIVSIVGIDRNKDLTPTHLEDMKTSGGAANFLNFITTELIPYINKKYPTNGDNTLWGHSLGGLFVVNALLVQPGAFKSYIAVDPSLWWDKEYIKKIAPEKLAALAGRPITLFMGGREGTDGEGMKIAGMDSVLKKAAPASLKWKSVKYPDETHASVRLKTTYDGLKFSYGWQTGRIEFHPMNGIVVKNKPWPFWYFGDTTKVRYTLDGSVPTIASAKTQPELALMDGAKITVKQFTNRARYDKVKTGEFLAERAFEPVSKPRNLTPGGFHYAYYETGLDSAANFKNLKPQQEGITNASFDPEKMPLKNNFALVIDGFLEAKEEGYYIFGLEADKDSKLYINNRILMNWQGDYNNLAYSCIVPLKKGFYPFRLEYRHKIKDFKLRLTYLTPGKISTKEPIDIPTELQWAIPAK
jgi:predicted alpha/beta superfamily hydrolase